MSQLRDYQAAQVEGVREAMRAGKRAILMQAPTGAGKTFTAAECIRASVALGFRVVFAAHLDALIDDTSERLEEAGIEHGVIQAARPRKPDAAVQVASLATLHRRQEAPPADLFILDECHRAMASTVRGVLDRYPRADLLGLTATPQRGDGQPLGDVFEVMVPGPSMKRLIEGGRIVPARVYSPPSPTLRGALAMDPVEALERYAPARPAIGSLRHGSYGQVAIEVDGPHHFCSNTRAVLGRTAARNRLLTARAPATPPPPRPLRSIVRSAVAARVCRCGGTRWCRSRTSRWRPFATRTRRRARARGRTAQQRLTARRTRGSEGLR